MHTCVHESFASQAARQPEAIAAVCVDDRISYAELNDWAERTACALRRLGVGPEVTVGIFLEPSIAMSAAILGVWKAGGAYVPLDRSDPIQRVRDVLRDARVPVILIDAPGAEFLSPQDTQDVALVRLDAFRHGEAIAPAGRRDPGGSMDPGTLACVMYTSGSDGAPKGVMISHRALWNHMRWMQRMCPLGAGDRVIQTAPFGLDSSVWEICAPLIAGGRLIVSPTGKYRDPAALADTIAREGVTALKVEPSFLRELLEMDAITRCVTLRYVFCGAERLPPELAHRFYERLDAVLYNLYGPTETATDVTWWRCKRGDARRPLPIGCAIDRTQIYVLDERLRPVPQGLAGELCVSGESLGRGYWHRPDLTAERFVPHEMARTPGERLYRTGDQVRWLGDGTVEYIGRLDGQVTLRGFRVDPGEIEAVLRQYPKVREAAVVAREDEPGVPRLIAYVVAAAGMKLAAGELDELKKYLANRLPAHMAPGVIVGLDTLPRLPSGKLDRQALAALGLDDKCAGTPHRAPNGDIEQRLVDLWQEMLHTDRVGVHDDFFELGGDSIISIQIVSRAAQRGLKLRVRQIFEHPTIAELALHVTLMDAPKTSEKPETVEIGESGGAVPLTPIQSWFFGQRLANPHHFNQAALVEITGATLPDVEARVARWLAAHAVLRQRWQPRAGGWSATELASEPARVVTCVDLSAVPPDALARELQRQTAQIQASLHLTKGPLLRVALFDRRDGWQRLFIAIHHLAVDGVSWRILMNDWQHGPAPATAAFTDWARAAAAFARTPAAEADAGYWFAQADAAVDAWPVDRPAGANTVACTAKVTTRLSASETQALVQQGSQASLQATLLAACAHAFGARLGVRLLRIDMEGHGREDAIAGVDVSRTVGWFTTIYPLVFTCPSGGQVEDTRRAMAAQLHQVPHRGITFGLLRYLGARPDWRARLAAMPPAPVSFNYLGQFNNITDAGFRLAPESPGPTQSPAAMRTHEIQITATMVERSLRVHLAYSRDRYDRETIAGVAAAIHDALYLAARSDALVDVPAKPTRDSRIVRIGATGGGAPLFCVSSYGDAPLFIFRDLARELHDRHPVSGLRVDSEDGEFSYERCGARHVEAIRSFCPHGPYVLAGYSLGGLVAFEIARQLEAAGDDVPQLILFDTVCPTTQQDMQLLDDVDLLGRILCMRDPELRLPQEIQQLTGPQKLACLHAEAIRRGALSFRAGANVSDVRAFLRLWRQRAAYVPRGFSGRVLLLRTSDTSILHPQFTQSWALTGETLDSLGWRLVEPCALTVIRAPGEHANFLFRPHVAKVAAHVADWITPTAVAVRASY